MLTTFCCTLRDWAARQPDIGKVLLVGSQARSAARGDSDVDLVVLTSAPQRYLADTAWAGQFGVVLNVDPEDYGALQALRVFYAKGNGSAAGLEVEWGFALPSWLAEPLDPGTVQVLAGGCRLIFSR